LQLVPQPARTGMKRRIAPSTSEEEEDELQSEGAASEQQNEEADELQDESGSEYASEPPPPTPASGLKIKFKIAASPSPDVEPSPVPSSSRSRRATAKALEAPTPPLSTRRSKRKRSGPDYGTFVASGSVQSEVGADEDDEEGESDEGSEASSSVTLAKMTARQRGKELGEAVNDQLLSLPMGTLTVHPKRGRAHTCAQPKVARRRSS
jgi:hypothetical protein